MGSGGAAGGFSRGQVIGAPRQEPTTLVGLANPRPVGRGRRVGAGGCARAAGPRRPLGPQSCCPRPGSSPAWFPPEDERRRAEETARSGQGAARARGGGEAGGARGRGRGRVTSAGGARRGAEEGGYPGQRIAAARPW